MGSYNIATLPLRAKHYYIVLTASLGQLIGTAVATIAGVIIPLLNIITRPELSGFMQGLIGAADLIGISIGSFVIGKLSDKYGYLFFFRFCPALIIVSSLVSIIFSHVAVLTLCLFVIGIGIGGEYSLDSNYVSELLPDRYKSMMVGVTKASSAFGNIIAAGVCFGMLIHWNSAAGWPELMWIVFAIATLMLLLRIRFYESPGWLISKGRIDEARTAVKKFLGQDVDISPTAVANENSIEKNISQKNNGTFAFIIHNWREVVLSGVPWACEGLGVYGIGVFLPILVMALGIENIQNSADSLHQVADSVKITLYISCIILPGFIAGLWLLHKKINIILIQTLGFILCTLALLLLMPAYAFHWNKWIAIGAFMAFEFFLNLGPHLITFVLPPKIFPVAQRGEGVGLAACIGKIGAIVGVFVIPILLKIGGALLVLGVSAAVMALGALITLLFRKTLEQ